MTKPGRSQEKKYAVQTKEQPQSVSLNYTEETLPVADVLKRIKAIPFVQLTPKDILTLQRAIGNKTLQRRSLPTRPGSKTPKYSSEAIQSETQSHEMIPGFFDSYRASPQSMNNEPIIQCDKIDYRQLTWDDFKGTPPKKSAREAVTYSELHQLELDNLVPASKSLTVEDTGEECKLGGKKATKHKINIKIDSEKLEIQPFMWQEESWNKPWTTDTKAREKKCKKEYVPECKKQFKDFFKKKLPGMKKEAIKACRKNYDDALVQYAKQYAKQWKGECENAFKKGQTKYSFTFDDGTTLTYTSKKKCGTTFKQDFINYNIQNYWSYSVNQTKKATTKKECHTIFAKSYEQQKKKNTPLTWEEAGTEVTVIGQDSCGTEFFVECKSTIMPAASDALLQHEQTHFDITAARALETQAALRRLIESFNPEVIACGKKKALQNAKNLLKKNSKKLTKLYNKQWKAHNDEQDIYDTETTHGAKAPKQEVWTQQVEKRLDKLKAENAPPAEEPESPSTEEGP
ncbi:MAG: hypothetical protein GY799_21565 [Desulfobulbaceae bacterium]|nr:hypothetical protein [Desulfobulbaceae bacterium]